MSKQLALDPKKCTACRTCELMCSFGHTGEFSPSLSSVSVIYYEDNLTAVPVMCVQCKEAYCVDACPAGAIKRNEDGVVVISEDDCIGCQACVDSCPLSNIKFSPVTEKAFKCDLCGGEPKCAKFCKFGAIEVAEGEVRSLPKDLPECKYDAAKQYFKEAFGEEA